MRQGYHLKETIEKCRKHLAVQYLGLLKDQTFQPL